MCEQGTAIAWPGARAESATPNKGMKPMRPGQLRSFAVHLCEQAKVLRGISNSALCDDVAPPFAIHPHTDAHRAGPPGARKNHAESRQATTRDRPLDPPRMAVGGPHS